MLNILKKVEGLRHGDGGTKTNSLEPPANLPELARDMYEHEQIATIHNDTTSSTENGLKNLDGQNKNIQNINTNASLNFKNVPSYNKPLIEPDKDSVPRLDLSLVKQHISASQTAIEAIQPIQPTDQSHIQSSIQPNTQYLQSSQPIYRHDEKPSIQKSVSQGASQSLNYDNTFNNMGMNNNFIDDSSGFFKEFEEYVRNNGLDNDIVTDLLNRNWLDHMLFYHTIKGEEMPFYASSAELSHAIKLKLEDLQSFERNWVMNKQKIDLLKKLGSTLESDIHLMSEELKKLMIESKKRNLAAKSGDLKSSGFFQLVKPKVVGSSLENKDVQSTYLASNISGQSVYSSLSVPSVEQNTTSFKFSLSKYISIDSSKYFYAQNGLVFKSLSDLMDGLESMDVETFNHHVNFNKNDFSNWIKGVFGDIRLADAIRYLTDREKLWYYLKNNTN